MIPMGIARRLLVIEESKLLSISDNITLFSRVLLPWRNGRGGENSLWGGRPDILIERYSTTDDNGADTLSQVFIGEVKYTQNFDYAATGLRELLEYMAFVKYTDSGEYVEGQEGLLEGIVVKGVLFVDELSHPIPPGSDVDIF